jgi:4-diphosphocytidyl-2-methyl-D-erithritol synthase
MNIGVIFAGGVGSRMHSKDLPKQFLEIHSKPIIIHTLEYFERNEEIDAVVISCVPEWIHYLEKLLYKYRIEKVKRVVSGGATGQLSIYNGLLAAREVAAGREAIVLIHDGVRPLISEELLSANIESVRKYGSAITSAIVKETIVLVGEDGTVEDVPSRQRSRVAKAPQSFRLDDILAVHEQALRDGICNSIDSCTLMQSYGRQLHMIEGPYENIKITTPDDFYTMRAILDARENEQIYGLNVPTNE